MERRQDVQVELFQSVTVGELEERRELHVSEIGFLSSALALIYESWDN